MGLFSGLASIATANSDSKNTRGILRHQRNIDLIKNFQAKRSFVQAIRSSQAQAVVGTLAAGSDFGSSRSEGAVASIGSQGRTIAQETLLQEKSSKQVFKNTKSLNKNAGIRQIGQGVDALIDFEDPTKLFS